MSINETLKQKIDELDLDRRADELVEQAQQALATARERAGSLADEHGDEVRTWIDRAATTIDSRTDGRWSEQVGRVREQLSTGIERLAERDQQHDGSSPWDGPADSPTDPGADTPGGPRA